MAAPAVDPTSFGPSPATLGMTYQQQEEDSMRTAKTTPSKTMHAAAAAAAAEGPVIVRLKGLGARMSAGGLYSCYDERFPPELSNALSEHDFQRTILKINDDLANNSPCFTCNALQYLCCPCTLGGSILCVRCMCQSIAMTGLRQDLVWANMPSEQGGRQTVEWRLGESCWDTWLEIEVLQQQQQQQPPRS